MTLEELDSELPNGLHDAEILSIHHDLLNRIVVLDIDAIWLIPPKDVNAIGARS
jgi:hypothetical protein